MYRTIEVSACNDSRRNVLWEQSLVGAGGDLSHAIVAFSPIGKFLRWGLIGRNISIRIAVLTLQHIGRQIY